MTPVVVQAPSPVVRGRPDRPALAPDANAHAGRPWSAESRADAHRDAARWAVAFVAGPPCARCGWPYLGLPCPCGGAGAA